MAPARPVAATLPALLAVGGGVAAATVSHGRSAFDELAIVVALAAYAAVGLIIELARPGHPVGRLVLAGSLAWGLGEGLLAVGVAGTAGPDEAPGFALTGVLGSASRGLGWWLLVLALPLVFPDGRAPSRAAVRLVAVAIAGSVVAMLIAPTPLDTRLQDVRNPVGLPPSLQVVADLTAVAALAVGFVALVAVVRSLVRRWRSGGELLRQQVLVFGVAFSLPLVMLVLTSTAVARPWMFALVTWPTPLAVGLAMFQHRMYDVQLAANRTLTYGALSAVLAGVYALIVGGVGALLRDHGTGWLPWAAAGVVAVAFAPLRDSLQRGVNLLIYGRWSSPAAALAGTARRLADAADAHALLRSLTDELVSGLGLASAVIHDMDGHRLAASGTGREATNTLALTAYGRQVGTLGWAGRPLRTVDLELLNDVAHQVGAAVHAAGMLESLRFAREQLVLSREQERRRLRRDLHDGLGPALAGLGLHVDAAQNILSAGGDASPQLRSLREGLQHTVVEVRRVVEGLRPPAVDDLGLFGAVTELAHELAGGAGLCLELDLPETGRAIPAGVEVAAYRVAQEALTNVVRHADASRCSISARFQDDQLVLSIADDGRGGARAGCGVGLASMSERAGEIGGRVDVTTSDRGTTVVARLPATVEVTS